jgi:hypothetical protein
MRLLIPFSGVMAINGARYPQERLALYQKVYQNARSTLDSLNYVRFHMIRDFLGAIALCVICLSPLFL